jgi:hypothetical protein
MTDNATFHNGTVQRVDFRLIHSHCAIAELLQIAQLRKNSPFTRFTERHYGTPPENPDTPETTRMILKSTQATTEKERFFITNIIKGHKVIDLTRPNELGTTTSKLATKSLGRTRL